MSETKTKRPAKTQSSAKRETKPKLTGRDKLRKSAMMAHLLDALEAGTHVGHYGQLTFVMVARHFLKDKELIELLVKQPDMDAAQAKTLVKQVKDRDYSPPSRGRILEWQQEQDFPICPMPDDPDCGNVYRSLRFPEKVYHHISDYQQAKADVADDDEE